jgi:hypothetical protein
VTTELNGEGSLVVDSISAAAVETGQDERLSDKQVNMMDAVKEAIRDHGKAGKVHMDRWREVAYSRGFLDDDATKRSKQFDNLRSKLIAKVLIRVTNEMVELHSGSVARKPPTPSALPSDAPMPPGL